MKEFIRPDDLLRDSFNLARQVYQSGYQPEVLLVLWRGGTPVGMVVHEYLLYKGIETYHTAVKAVSYQGIGRRAEVRLEHFETILAGIPTGARVLVIDDIFDSGHTISAVRNRLLPRTDRIKAATLYWKPAANQTDLQPDFYVREVANWLVFPHELMDLTPDEIARKHPPIADMLA